jgi:hypothetical protein
MNSTLVSDASCWTEDIPIASEPRGRASGLEAESYV